MIIIALFIIEEDTLDLNLGNFEKLKITLKFVHINRIIR
jgi:hypothetical protein